MSFKAENNDYNEDFERERINGIILSILREAEDYLEGDDSKEVRAIIDSFPDYDRDNAIFWINRFIDALEFKNYSARAEKIRKNIDHM